MPRLDPEAIAATNRTGYPAPFDAPVAGRWYRRIGPAFGLTSLGASHVTLEPGGWSSQRHWHDDEDELLVMISGHAVLIEGPEGEPPSRTLLGPGDTCVWAAGDGISHHLVNESDAPCTFVAVSAGDPDGSGGYPDIDLMFAGEDYLHKDGTLYPKRQS